MSTSVIEALKVKIDGHPYDIDDPKPVGRQLLDKAGKRPAEEYVIFMFQDDGLMEEIRLEETIDLRKPGIEKFITFKTDRIFRFLLESRSFEWGAPIITVPMLKNLADVPPEKFDVWQKLKDGTPILLEDNQEVDLSGAGVESFELRPAKKLITVSYNHHDVEIEKGTYTTEQLLGIFQVPSGYILDLIVNCEFIELKTGEKLKVKKGMIFVSHAPRGESS